MKKTSPGATLSHTVAPKKWALQRAAERIAYPVSAPIRNSTSTAPYKPLELQHRSSSQRQPIRGM